MVYAGIPDEFCQLETSKIVILPVPYDETSTWLKGADLGPEALIEASANVELYDIETDSEVYTKGIFTSEPVLEKSSPEQMVDAVYDKTKEFLDLNKFVVVLGGEHSVSVGTIKAHAEKYANLSVLQLDAHSDMRAEYNDSPFNHACAMARASEYCPVYHVGIRSMDASEKQYIKPENIYYAHEIRKNNNWIPELTDKLTENVYVTIDLDVFDPSIMPATGTPEPGGLYWYQVLDLLNEVNKKRNIVGFDVVELCPNEHEKSSDFMAAKLVYQFLSFRFAK